jgi:hypothetical protein
MKIICVLLLYPVLLNMLTCNPHYGCGRQCYSYKNDSIEICQTSYAEAQQFTKTADSLNRIYGAGISFLVDSVTVSGSSNNAMNSIANQLEQQGYTCIYSD